MVGMLFSIPVANMKLTIGPSPHGGVADHRERARALKVASARIGWGFATTRRRPSYSPHDRAIWSPGLERIRERRPPAPAHHVARDEAMGDPARQPDRRPVA